MNGVSQPAAPQPRAESVPAAKMQIDVSSELALLDELTCGLQTETVGCDSTQPQAASIPATPTVGHTPSATQTTAAAPPECPNFEVLAGSGLCPGAEPIKLEPSTGATTLNTLDAKLEELKHEADVKKGDDGVKGEGMASDDEDSPLELDADELLAGFKAGEDNTEVVGDTVSMEDALKAFLDDVRVSDRDNEVNRILWAFKLNPFDKLNLQFTATEAEVKKQYRKISLLIHPDKCKHPQAADAFEVLGAAQKELLDEDRRAPLMRMLEYAREHVREERRKSTKHDPALRLAASLHAAGREGVEREWEESTDFHNKWREKAHDVLARAEFRRRKVTKRTREEEERVTAEEKKEAEQRKRMRADRKEWLQTRGKRVESWRDWSKSGKKFGGTKAPKIKTWDTEKSYVQRATTEQFIGNYKKKAPK